LLKLNETITEDRSRLQLMRLSRTLKEDRPQYEERHDKVILQHDNARPHIAKPVKIYLETLIWEILSHLPYSPDVAPSDYHLFRSMTHGLVEQHFHSYEDAKKWVDSWIISKDESFFRHVKLLHDNARPYIASNTKDTIMSLGWDVLQHPAYSPDIAPSDYYLFRSMQHALSDMHFQSVDEIRKWLDNFIMSKDVTFFRDGIRKLLERWLKVIESNGEYF
ncbi:Histone-lysine N-methyltransferase SETMAR, partial [Harpegnathos saltator]